MAEHIKGFDTKDGTALVDYDYLANKPVQRIVSDSADTATVLREFESGSYILQGKFRAYTGATGVLSFSSALLVNVIKSSAKSSVQIFYPTNNCVQFLEITDEAMTRTNVYLNQLLENIGTMKNLNTAEKATLVGAINELVARLNTDTYAVSVDLSALETDGTIVETLSDGSTKTTTMEFDADGNPVKITDADGNETVLTW